MFSLINDKINRLIYKTYFKINSKVWKKDIIQYRNPKEMSSIVRTNGLSGYGDESSGISVCWLDSRNTFTQLPPGCVRSEIIGGVWILKSQSRTWYQYNPYQPYLTLIGWGKGGGGECNPFVKSARMALRIRISGL